MKITKKEFDLLYSDDITKKKYDEIIGKIDKRFFEIVNVITRKKGQHAPKWFDYGNCDYETENSNGHFDIINYKDNIKVGGEWVSLFEPYVNSFPTRWLCEDFEQEFKDEVEEKDIRNSIESKLTKEEMKYVMFKTFNNEF